MMRARMKMMILLHRHKISIQLPVRTHHHHHHHIYMYQKKKINQIHGLKLLDVFLFLLRSDFVVLQYIIVIKKIRIQNPRITQNYAKTLLPEYYNSRFELKIMTGIILHVSKVDLLLWRPDSRKNYVFACVSAYCLLPIAYCLPAGRPPGRPAASWNNGG